MRIDRCARAVVLAVAIVGSVVVPTEARSATLAPQLRRYPYLTDAAGSSARINWATDRSSSSASVLWGPASEGCTLSQQVAATKIAITVNSVSEYQWTASIGGLSPRSAYCYRVLLGATDLLGSDPSPTFTSAPPSTSSSFSFAVLGDWGFVDSSGFNPYQEALIKLIADIGADFVVTTGDQPYGTGSQTNYGDLAYGQSTMFGPTEWPVAGRSIPIYPLLGNEGLTGVALKNFPQGRAVTDSGGRFQLDTYCCLNGTKSATYPTIWYAFEIGNARFYLLDTSWRYNNVGSGTLYEDDYDYHWTQSSPQYRWLQNDLATHPSELKFAFFHFPLYTDTTSQTSDAYLHGPDSLEGLLSENGVDVTFSGHTHIYERNDSKPGSVINYVSGGGGAKLLSVATCSSYDAYAIGWSPSRSKGSACHAPTPSSAAQVYHFLLVTVEGPTVTVKPTNSLGETFDVRTYHF